MTKEKQEAFVKAKESMAKILQKENMYQSYVNSIADNIAMILWGSYMSKEFTTFSADCNKAAKRIIAVIFDIKER